MEAGRKPSFSGVEDALRKVADVVVPTPLVPLAHGESILWCKCESEQPMRAFKLRGAWHRLTDLTEAERAGGVVAFSSGNHAQGVAWAAQRLGMPALIVMPADAPEVKVAGTRALGAEIVFYDRMTEKREVIAASIAADRGATLVPSFDDPWVVEGQGSAGLEAVAQLAALGKEAPDLVIMPCGGGGLAAGLALALPDARVVVVEPEGWDDMGESLRRGEIVPVGPNPPPTSCDAIQTLRVAPITFDILKARGATGVAVSEEETFAAMRHAKRELGLTIEPGGAVALAAILSGKVTPGARTLVLLSGSNVDPLLFDRVMAG
ncbi:threonine/serine dehydratase [Chakrabartia godavariana]|nr:threonine/serine dehydratase [Chakrabartia godavariana]